MWHYMKFELKNTIGYSIAMIVGGLLPIILVIGNYHDTSNVMANQALAKSLFSTLLPMISLGLVILPFTIAFGRDVSDGVTMRLVLFGYTMTKQLIAKFVSVLILVILTTTIYCVVLTYVLPLPSLSAISLINIYLSVMMLSAALFLLSFSIAQVFQGFNMIQGIAMLFYFGIAFLTGSMGSFDLPSTVTKVTDWIPFKVIRETLTTHWQTSTLLDFKDELFKLVVFLIVTAILFVVTKSYRQFKTCAV
ncbi:MFS transporter permease [Leuconostoc palmae]|uniref:MFS transporter permease n=1 Tax=Leuconostoc palmae TaxID=501487 RepID=UPI001C7CABE1|nr:MFS transporter permease [Leuconostoc palmae]